MNARKKIEGAIKNEQSTETDYIGYIGHNTRTNKAKKNHHYNLVDL